MDRSHGTTQPARDWLWLVLILAVLPVRLWILSHTEVTARDSIGYIRYALDLEERGWAQTVLRHHQHPGYSVSILAWSVPVRAWFGTTPESMQLAAQLASSTWALLLTIPLYFLGRHFFSRSIAFVGVLLFHYLPISAHHLSDGVSEAQYLFFVLAALWCGVVGLKHLRWEWFAGCGVFCGLAYLTRPEGAVLFGLAVANLVGAQVWQAARRPWKPVLAGTACLIASALAVSSVYYAVIGGFTNKPSVGIILNGTVEGPSLFSPRLAMIFAGSVDRPGLLHRVPQALSTLAFESVQMMHYTGFLPLVVGCFAHLPRLLRVREFFLPLGFLAVMTAILTALGVHAGYISDRHILVFLAWWVFFAAAGFEVIARWIAGIVQRPAAATSIGILLLGVFFLACLPRTLQTLHVNRVGNRAAGQWLAERVRHGDYVDDDHSWSHFYAGLVFKEGKDTVLPRYAQPTTYTVMTRSRDPEVAQVRMKKEADLERRGGIVYHWPEHVPQEKARIVVFAMPRDKSTHPWHISE